MRNLAPLLLIVCSGCYQSLPDASNDEAKQAEGVKAHPTRPDGPVADFGEILAPADEAMLDRKLRQIMNQNQTAVFVVTVRSLDGQAVDRYARVLANQWNVGGPRGGVVILVAPNERKVRIGNDKKVQSRFSNERCAEILRTAIIPYFRSGNYAGGIASGLEAMQRYL